MLCLGFAIPSQPDAHEMCTEMCVKPFAGRALHPATLLCPASHGKDKEPESGMLGGIWAALTGVVSRDSASWRLV